MKYKKQSYTNFSANTDLNILLITATPLETKTLHECLISYEPSAELTKVIKDGCHYYIGKWGKYNVIHVQSHKMGSVNAANTTTSAFKHWKNIKIVFMIGICFGINNQKYKIGDILVAENIVPYEIARIGDINLSRGTHLAADPRLINLFKAEELTWNDEEYNSNIHIGMILSGEKLVDNLDFRDQLLKAHPTSIGGEMEGAGLAEACFKESKPWVLIKSICDFADGNKSDNKSEFQKIAAKTAIKCCSEIFNSEFVFDDFFINARQNNQQQPINTIPKDIIKEVLFDHYSEKHEPHYLVRDIDNHLSQIIEFSGAWVYGISGSGKTTALQRALIKNKKDFFFINLASCVNITIDNFFKEIYLKLLDKYQNIKDSNPNNFNEYISEINKILINIGSQNKDFYLFIEEIPLQSNDEYQTFVPKLNSLIISNKISECQVNIKFILSSIESPEEYIPSIQQKVKQSLIIQNFDLWSDVESKALIDKIISTLQLDIKEEQKALIQKGTKNSPRIIKAFFRNAFIQNIYEFDNKNIQQIIIETKQQFKD